MKNYLVVFIAVVWIQSALGENLTREINWTQQSDSVYAGPIARFPGAYITENGLPVYQEVIDLAKTNQKVKITHLVFETFEPNHSKHYSGIKDTLIITPRYIHSKSNKQALLDFIPIIFKNNQYKKLISFDIETVTNNEKLAEYQQGTEWKESSVLANGHWVKIRTSNQGIYKIPYDQLKSWGFSDPSSVHLYGNGGYMMPKMNSDFFYDDLQQDAILRAKDGDGNDCIFFYSTGTVRWKEDGTSGKFTQEQNNYSNYAYYFLSDQGDEKSVSESPAIAGNATKELTTFDEHICHEQELENLIHSGRRWFGEKFAISQSRNLSIELDDPVNSQPIQVEIVGAGRSGATSRLNVSINNSSQTALTFSKVTMGSDTGLYADLDENSYTLNDSPNELNFKFTYIASSSPAMAWLDYITVNYKRNLTVNNQLMFRDATNVGEGNITEFKLTTTDNNLKIWDVTNYTEPVSMPYSIDGNTASFKASTDQLREFVGFNTDAELPNPEYVEDVTNQNLHEFGNVDMVIISAPEFLTQANELAQFHRDRDHLSVSVVTPDLIYNEFSGGAPDVAAIRNFLKMQYDRDGSILKYVLLFGDGSYDNKNISGNANNYILTYQSPNSLLPTSSFVTDDFYALLDDGEGEYEGKIDLGIGRIPASTVTEAKIAVDKIKHYASTETLGDWRNVICFIADDEDSNTHMRQADGLADMVNNSNQSFFTDKIYFDAYVQKSTSAGERYPDVTTAINKRVKDGALILNYTGHANDVALAHEKVLGTSDIDNWSNYDKLPIFVTATCEFSRFDADESSGGEHIYFNANGGGICLFSTTRVVWSNENDKLNIQFYKNVFKQDSEGNNLRMGEVMRLAKNGVTGTNKRNFTLIGDPALSLAFPQYKVKTETINGKPAEQLTDTIGSLSRVTITGKVTDNTGATLENFNGELIPIVYDKAHQVETLGNGGETPFDFSYQNNIIYQGVTTVTNGKFEFSFVVPKDISYSAGQGKIIYYANNGEIDAQGYFNNFNIGGTSTGSFSDTEGPQVNLFLNDSTFKSGDEVGKKSILIANIEDESGINTAGVGIGHDITAILDNDYNNILVLNDSYLSDKDSYKKGQVIYPLSSLTAGEHTLKFKVWDVLNNSTEVEIHFIVSNKLEITEVNCYPNPATNYTNFVFKHNRPDDSFDTKIEIYDFSGNLVDVLNQRLGSNGSESLPLLWQINDSQMLIRSGAYLYRVTIDADDGYSASKTGKIIISRY